jgi:hypothetical protein
MKHSIITSFIIVLLASCNATKKINQAIATKEVITVENKDRADSIRMVNETVSQFKSNYIDFKTFNAKIKVESTGSKGKNPDITAVVRIIKDSAIWMSLSATFINIEVYRVLITPDSVILINKQDKEVQYRSLDYLQEVTEIPFNFKTLQDLIVGNPIFLGDSINSFRRKDDLILFSSIDEFFKNLFTITSDQKLMLHSKMDDVDHARSRTADMTYGQYDHNNGCCFFSTDRQIVVSEKNKLEIQLNFKQYEFNKELSVAFPVPKNYIRK